MNARPQTRHTRSFHLVLEAAGAHTYGVVLEEVGATPTERSRVARATAQQVQRIMPALLDAVKASRQAKTALGPNRKAPIELTEQAGVRLGLVLLSTGPVVKSRRTQEMIDGVAGMTGEETYYWYSKVTGVHAQRFQRALRLFLAEE